MKIKILGSGQDGGIPHTGCYCAVCMRARRETKYKRLAPSVAIFDKSKFFLIDASPDIKLQLDMVKEEANLMGQIPISGILLTHSHFGHCAGLWHLGLEAMDAGEIPVYCTPMMNSFLSNNYPFSLIIQRRNIVINEIAANVGIELGDFKCKSILVPHRNEIADTVGFLIKATKSLIYIPDTDSWTPRIIEEINKADVALLDGTFYSKEEIPRYNDIPHPPISETLKKLKGVNTEIYFTHINHTNAVNFNGKESEEIAKSGFGVAYDGMVLEI